MEVLYSIFFGAGLAGFAYSRANSRLGYGNPQAVWTVAAVVFVISSIVFYTIIKALNADTSGPY
jgi:phosphotransferase system  glucose/maltose/N-acetylglucosamine-specific IIC component